MDQEPAENHQLRCAHGCWQTVALPTSATHQVGNPTGLFKDQRAQKVGVPVHAATTSRKGASNAGESSIGSASYGPAKNAPGH